jgi:hypothetical protein
MSSSSTAQRVDAAVDALLDGTAAPPTAALAGLGASERRLVLAGDRLRDVLPVPVAPRFEARLGARLADAADASPMAWARRHPGRLIVTGAVGSAVGVGVTAYAVWRSSRRPAGAAHRLLHR